MNVSAMYFEVNNAILIQSVEFISCISIFLLKINSHLSYEALDMYKPL